MSGQLEGQEIDLRAVREGADAAAQSGVPHAELLLRFADALVAHDDAGLELLRAAITEALGPEGLLETASIAANFQRMARIADATGIPQDAPLMAIADDLIEELSLRDFGSAANTPETGALLRLVGKLIRPIAPKLMRFLAGRIERQAQRKGSGA